MLNSLRSLAKSPIALVLIIAPIVAAFALFGISDIFTGSGNAVALVGPERVTTRDLNIAYERELTRLQQQNPGFTREQADEAGLGERVLDRLVTEAALDAKSEALGLSVSDAHLAETIESIDAFAGAFSGEFDPQTYRSVLAQNQLTPTLYESSLRKELRRQQYIVAALGGIAAPDVALRARQAFANETRTVRALLLTPELAGDPGEPTDEALQTLIDENPQFFEVPETRRFTLVRARPEDLAADVEVDEADLRALYEDRLARGELADPATRSFLLIAAPGQAEAEAAAEAIRAGSSPEQAAAAQGLAEPAEFNAVQAFQVPDAAVAEAVFDMSAGETRAVEGRLGWRVVSVREAVDPPTPAFEAVQAELQQELARDEAEARVFDALSAFEEARAGGQTLEAAAEAAGLFAERFDRTAANGAGLDGRPLATLRQQRAVLDSVFELPAGFPSDLIELDGGGYFVARVDEIVPASVPPLEDVRERATAIWEVRNRDAALEAVVADALARAEAGEDLDAIAADLGSGARVEQASLTRDETAGPFSRSLVGAAFAAQPETPFAARAGDGRVRAVAVVSQISRSRALPRPEEREALQAEYQNDLAAALQAALLEEYEPSVDTRLRDLALGRTQPDAP